jgi:acyl-CoA synthetase (AMP-forming)/AMP-acid ligase II
MRSKLAIRIIILAFATFGIGCATTSLSPRHSDAELELAQRDAEDETLARLATSVSIDIADAASTIARERAIR